ncbi:MAG: hypothetical protein ACOCSE_05660 [Chitinivibrionales bacterium]
MKFRNRLYTIFLSVLACTLCLYAGSKYDIAEKLVRRSKALDFSEYTENTIESLIKENPEMEEYRDRLYNAANVFLYSDKYTEAKIKFLTLTFTEEELKNLLVILQDNKGIKDSALGKKYQEMKTLIQGEIKKRMKHILDNLEREAVIDTP